MKYVLVIFFFLSPLFTSAQDASSNTNVLDLSYVPPIGGHQISASYASATDKADASVLGFDYFSQKVKRSNLSLSYYYGISEKIQFGVKYLQSLSYEVTNTYGPASTANGTTETLKYSGSFDPSIGVNFRLKDQKSSPLNLDLRLIYTPKFFKSKIATATMEGTVAAGGDSKSISLKGSKKSDELEFAGYLLKVFNGKSTSESQTGGSSSESDERGSLELGAQLQYTIDQFMLGAGLALTSYDSYETGTPGSKVKYPSRNSTALSLNVNYLFNNDNGITFTYAQITTADYGATSGSNTINAKNVVTSGYSIGYSVAF